MSVSEYSENKSFLIASNEEKSNQYKKLFSFEAKFILKIFMINLCFLVNSCIESFISFFVYVTIFALEFQN